MTCMDTRPHSQRHASGQSAVEVALMLPALIILVLGMVAAGFSFYAFIQVTNAAREGARAGSLVRLMQNDPNYSDLSTAAQKAICNSSAGTSALGFLTPPSNCNSSSFNVASDVVTAWTFQADSSTFTAGDQFRVDITYRFTIPVLSRMLPMFPRPIVIKRTVFMEVQ